MSDKNKRIRRTFRAAEGDWRRVDLHLHTPASADWLEPGVTYLQWLQKAESRGLDVVAITDHNTVEGIAKLRAEIERLTWMEANDRLRPQERRDLDEYRRLGEKILVLPGFEFTATFGFHVLAIFPPETPLRVLELLLLRLNVPVDRLTEGSTEVGATADVLTAYRLIDEAGGLVIAAHVNSAHGVAMRGLGFGGQTKIAYTQDFHLHALEVTDLEAPGRRSSAKFFDGTKPEYPRRMHCIQGSDAHRLTRDPKDKNRLGIGDRVTELLLAEVTFEALSAALKGDDFSVTRPYRLPTEAPFDHVQAAREQGETIIQSFHESMTVEGGRMNKVLADVVAFANTQGGTIYVGVSSQRKGAPRGVDDPPTAMTSLKREMERAITPSVACKVDVMQSQGVPVVRVSVPLGSEKPYALRQTRIYIRQEGETSEAARDEIVRLVLGARVAEGPTVGVQVPVVTGAAAKSGAMESTAEAPKSLPQMPAEAKPVAKSSHRRRRRPSGASPKVVEEPAVSAPLPDGYEEPAEVEIPSVETEIVASAIEAPAEDLAEASVVEEQAAEPIQIEESVVAEAAEETTQPETAAPKAALAEPAAAETPVAEPAVSESAIAEPAEVAPAEAEKPKRRTRRTSKSRTAAAESAAAVADATGQPAEAEKTKRRTRSTTKSKTEAEAIAEPEAVSAPGPEPAPVEIAAPEESVLVEAAPSPDGSEDESVEQGLGAEAFEKPDILEAPAVGVEIVTIETRDGVQYFTVRDLRNCNTVRNVTTASARKLWSYAINQSSKRPVDSEQVAWQGDYGLWQVGRRAKKLRYDLVKRQSDGSLRVFYGVTADGMDGPWAQFLKDEDRPE